MKNRVLTDEGFKSFDGENAKAGSEGLKDKARIKELESQITKLKHEYQSADELIEKYNEAVKHIAALETAQKEMEGLVKISENRIEELEGEKAELNIQIDEFTKPKKGK